MGPESAAVGVAVASLAAAGCPVEAWTERVRIRAVTGFTSERAVRSVQWEACQCMTFTGQKRTIGMERRVLRRVTDAACRDERHPVEARDPLRESGRMGVFVTVSAATGRRARAPACEHLQ